MPRAFRARQRAIDDAASLLSRSSRAVRWDRLGGHATQVLLQIARGYIKPQQTALLGHIAD